jgi:hypothetical protein
MSHRKTDDLIASLAADAAPVTPIRPGPVLGLFLLAAAALFALCMMTGDARPDMAQAMGHPMFWWKMGAFALPATAASVGVALALRPEAELGHVWRTIAALSLVALLAGVALSPGAGAGYLARIWRPEAWNCLKSVLGMGLPMAALFAFALSRGAPTRPMEAARMAGLAAGSWAAAVFALACPVDDPLYTLVWFTISVGLVALAASLAVPPLLRASWRRRG